MKLAPMFCNNVVLLRDSECNIWGESDGDVTITIDGEVVKAESVNGKFTAKLKPHSAGGPYTLKAEGDGEIIELEFVYFGEVFLASGQSNMAFTLGNLPQELDSTDQVVRMFTYERPWSMVNSPSTDMRWLDICQKNAGAISAAASHFAIELANTLKIPVGIVCNAQGASNVQSWISPETLSSDEAFINSGYKFNAEKDYVFNDNSYLYLNSLTKVAPYTVRGVLWYQGEGNTEDPTTPIYAHLFELLLNDWYELWNDKDLPFITVQVAPLEVEPHVTWEHLIEQQLIVYKTLKNVGMVTTADIGSQHDVHPKEKKILGKRLAKYALGMIYGFDGEYRPPYCKEMTVEGDTAVLRFANAGDGLYRTKELEFIVVDQDGTTAVGEYEINGDTIRVKANGIVPKEVRFAFKGWGEVFLYNSIGMPSSPFRITAK